MNTKNSITDIKTEILVKQNWNWNTCLIETEIHCKTIIETKLKYIANNGIEIETEIYLITDTTLSASYKIKTILLQPKYSSDYC